MVAHASGGEVERRPVTEAQRARAAEALAQLKADLVRVADQPLPPEADSERFFGPVGFDADGNLQPPLTPEEEARLAAARRGEPPDAPHHEPPGSRPTDR